MFIIKRRKIACLLAVAMILTGIPFPGKVQKVNATTEQFEMATLIPAQNEVEGYVINETFDAFAEGTLFSETSGKDYTATYSLNSSTSYGKYRNNAKVVSKTVVDGQASANDRCMEFTALFDSTKTQHLIYDLQLNEDVAFAMGPEVSGDRYIVFEMDMATAGEGVKTTGYGIYLSRHSGGTHSTARFVLFDDYFTRSISSGVLAGKNDKALATKGEFSHLKVVVDRHTGQYSYFWNGVLVGRDIDSMWPEAMTTLGTFRFLVMAEPTAEVADNRLYLDNVKLYSMADTPVPTPEPTASPFPRLEALLNHANTALTYGMNIEGSKYPNILVDGIDVTSMEPVIWNKFTDNQYYQSNLYGQSNFLKMLDGLTMITGDEKYRKVAHDQIKFRFDTPGLVDDNGLFYAGGHTVLDVKTGKVGTLYHETKDYSLPLELYWDADPEGTIRFVTAYWNAHVYDVSKLEFNRHGIYNKEMRDIWNMEYTNPSPFFRTTYISFTCTGNDMMEMAWFLTEKTGDPKYAVWAERMLDKYIAIGNPRTGLTGGQYGILSNPEDRFIMNFKGADFVTKSGVDFKTLDYGDSEILGETDAISANSLKTTVGYGAQVMIPIYVKTGNEKIYNYVKGNMLGVARYIYDGERHRYLTPMLNDGTDLNDGVNKLVAPRGGYYLSEGSSYAESEAPDELNLKCAIDFCAVMKPEDAAEKEEIWAMARTWAKNRGMGDIGTAMGENVNVNLKTSSTNPSNTLAAVALYKYTGHQAYYDLAVRMADNIVKGRYDKEKKIFIGQSYAPYSKFDTSHVYAVFCVEAMAQGFVNEINLDLSHGGSDYLHDGMGQASEIDVFYYRDKIPVTEVKFDKEQMPLVVAENPQADFTDIAGLEEASAIRQMASLGVLEGEPAGVFSPENKVTRKEFVKMVKKLCGIEDVASLVEFPYAGADADVTITREEAASVIVKALRVATPGTTYYGSNAMNRATDAEQVAEWATEYVDVAINHRLMMDLEDTSFYPAAQVTKAMAAEILQNVSRYLPLDVEMLNPAVVPFNADSAVISWTSSNTDIVEVDSLGRLYPVNIGTASIYATADGITGSVQVTVSENNHWMIKKVYIDGMEYEDFNPEITTYDLMLHKGTTEVPVITAITFDGEEVVISTPASLPGTATLKVQGFDQGYSIYLNPTLVEFTVDENFNRQEGTLLESIITEKFNWFINGTTVAYKPYLQVTPKNSIIPEAQTEDGYMVFPYKHALNVEGGFSLSIDENLAYNVGDGADDMLVIAEMDIAVRNMTSKENGFGIVFSEHRKNGGTYSVARLKLKDNELLRRVDNYSEKDGSRRYLQDNTFVNVKIVIDKKAKTYDYYVGGELLEKGIPFFHSATRDFGTIGFNIPNEENDSDAEMLIDNIKVYELRRNVVAEEFSQVPVPTVTPKPTTSPNPYWLYSPINETFDNYEPETKFSNLKTNQGYVPTSNNDGAIVVSRKEVEETSDASDYCLKIPYVHNSGDGKSLRLNILDNLVYKYRLGEAAVDTNAIVVEMDVAVKGEGVKENGYRICISQRYAGSTSSMARYVLNDTQLRHHNGSSTTYYAAEATKGAFHKLKLVIDKKSSTYKYYWDGQLMKEGQNPLHAGTPDVGCILIQCLAEAEDMDSALYIDNVKLYLYSEEPELPPDFGPTPTPVPIETPNPTATPIPDIADKPEIKNICSATTPATITPPAGGWSAGTNTFTVACEKPCFVAISYDGGQTYQRLSASQASSGYSFTAERVTANTILAVGYVGDINGDGEISNSDATRLAAIYAGKRQPDTGLMELICDVNGDGEITNSDITGLRANYAGKKQLNW